MFASFIQRLTQTKPEPLHDLDARLAISALLVRIARTDDDYTAIETDRIDRLIATRFELSDAESVALRRQAELLEREAPDTVRFTRAIKRAVPYEDRESLIEAFWEIVLADGVRDQEEDALLRLVADLLGINDRNSNLARKRVEARLT